MIRKSVVAGQFYPDDPKELKKIILGMMPEKSALKTIARGIILPHAGYVYSGKVAVTTVNKVFLKKNIILLGNNHSGQGEDFALWSNGEWETPLGNVPVNSEIAAEILKNGTTILADTLAHKFEHSIEVELPILQQADGDISIIPIACQPSIPAKYEAAANQICAAIKNRTDVMFVASTDMTHYEPDARVRKKDSLAIERILALDPEGLLNVIKKEHITMCGAAPVAVFLYCMKLLGGRKAQVALYQTSAEASNDYESVVGYAGIIVQ